MKYIITIFMILSAFFVKAQSNPSGFPTQANQGWTRWGWSQSDSGTIIAPRTPNFTPRFPGTTIIYQHAGIDSNLNFWNGGRWIDLIPGFDSTSLSNRINLKLNITDTTGKWWSVNKRWVDTVYRVNDSTIGFTINNGAQQTFQILGGASGGGGGVGTVTSVGLSMPSAFTVGGTNPITSSGTFNITGAGTSSDYMKGNGTLGVTDTSMIPNFYLKTRSLFSGASPITFNSATGVIGALRSNTTGQLGVATFNNTDFTDNGAGLISLSLPVTNGSCTNCSVTFGSDGRATFYSSGTAPSGVAVDTIFRTPGIDSIYFKINGTQYAIKDSTGSVSANNGLTKTGDIIQLGGSLIQPTTITSAVSANRIVYNGVSALVDGPQLEVSTSGSVGIAIKGASADGRGVLGTATTGVGVYGVATGSGGIGLFGISSDGSAVFSESTTGKVFEGFQVPSTTNTIESVASFTRSSSVTGANGIGGSFDFLLRSTTADQLTNQIIWKLTDATDATRTSALEFWNTNSATLGRKALLSGNGQWTWDGYPSLTKQTDSTTYKPLAYDASGNIVPMANWIGSGGGGTGNFIINQSDSIQNASAAIGGPLKIGTAQAVDPRLKVLIRDTSNPTGSFAAVELKTTDDRDDLNIDGATIVKHDSAYNLTPGYGNTLQVYTLAGSYGTIIGNNNFVGVDSPYAPTYAEVPNGFVRFELGPLWPRSEKMRLNNNGDIIFGWDNIRKYTASQSGTTVTDPVNSFLPTDVNKFFCWGDNELGGTAAFADRITGYIDAHNITVETSRTISSQGGRVSVPHAIVDTIGNALFRRMNVDSISFVTNDTTPYFRLKSTDNAFKLIRIGTATPDTTFDLTGVSIVQAPADLVINGGIQSKLQFTNSTTNLFKIFSNASNTYLEQQTSAPVTIRVNGIDNSTYTAAKVQDYTPLIISATPDAPIAKLDVRNPDASISMYLENTRGSGTNYGIISDVSATASENRAIYATATGASVNKAIVVSDLTGSGPNDFSIYSSTPAKAFLGGWVGIGQGNSVPAQALHVRGQVVIDTVTTGSNTDSVMVINNGLLKKVLQSSIGGGGTTIYTGDGTLSGNRTVTGNNLSLTFDTLFNFRVNANTFILAQKDKAFPYTGAVIAVNPHNYQLGYTPTATVYSKGAGLYIDTNNNVGLGTNIPSTTPLYATGNSAYVQGFQSFGGNFYKTLNKTADYTVTLTDNFITIDASGGNVTLTLPAASTAFGNNTGIDYVFKRIDNSVNSVTVQRAGSDTIDGATSFTLTTQYEAKSLRAISTSAWGIY